MPSVRKQSSIGGKPAVLLPLLLLFAMIGTVIPAIAENPFPDGQGFSSHLNEQSVYKSDNQARKAALHKVYKATELPRSKEVPDAFPDLQANYRTAESQAMAASGGHVYIQPAMSAGGHIDSFGHYTWTDPGLVPIVGSPTIAGRTAHPSLSTHISAAPGMTADLSSAPMLSRAFRGTNGLPATQAGVLSAMVTGSMAKVDKLRDPSMWTSAMTSMEHTKTTQSANNEGRCAEKNSNTSFEAMLELLINVANDRTAAAAPDNVTFKTYPQAIWMVQQMYKKCFIPMAILLLLPGALLTQARGMIASGLLSSNDEDSITPFQGIIRAALAVFLIPATQVIVSYVIDAGNSLSITVHQHIDTKALREWSHEQTFYTDPHKADNYLQKSLNPTEPAHTGGKLDGASSSDAVFEQQSHTSSMMQFGFNKLNNFVAQGLVILTAFQLILMCYLFLLGPIAAAFYAWPAGPGRTLFKKAFGSWLDGVIVLGLWKFWWCVILLCMSLRLTSGNVNPTDQFETYVYTSFMVLLLFVPFAPFDFRPGDLVSTLMDRAGHKGTSRMGGSSGGAGASGNGSSQSSPTTARCPSTNGAARPEHLSSNSNQMEIGGSTTDKETGGMYKTQSGPRRVPSLAIAFQQTAGEDSSGSQTSARASSPPPLSSDMKPAEPLSSDRHYSPPPPLTNGKTISPAQADRKAA